MLLRQLVKGKTPSVSAITPVLAGILQNCPEIGVRFGSTKAAQIVRFSVRHWWNCHQQVTDDIAKTAKDVYKERFLERKKSTES
jgi:hypothetical protein